MENPATYRDALVQFQSTYNTGDYAPFVWPYRALGPNLLIVYLLLPPTSSKFIYYARYPLFALIIYLSVSSMRECRSPAVTIGYAIGLLNAWTILWSATLIVFNDARANFRRIEVDWEGEGKEGGEREVVKRRENGGAVASGIDGSNQQKPRPHQLDKAFTRISEQSAPSQQTIEKASNATSANDPRNYKWQNLPPRFTQRLDWVIDLASNFRGLRWSHQISGTLPPPPSIQACLHYPSQPPGNTHTYPTRAELIKSNLTNFILCCLALDVLKTLALQDPYFWSLPPSTPSPFPLPSVSRLFISLLFTYTSILTIFLLSPLVFACLLGPQVLGQHASTWLYPDFFGNPKQVWRKGLAGLWGEWWHQLFRYAFEQAGEFMGGDLLGWKKKSTRGGLVRVAVAFLCSGALHACASYTTLGDTTPMGGPFAFFAVQPIGIIAQRGIARWMKQAGLRDQIPAWMRGVGNLVVVVLWCWVTGPLVADDFAACGIWLYEPLPISPLRGMMGDGWWRWGGEWVSWSTGGRWWQSGLIFLGG